MLDRFFAGLNFFITEIPYEVFTYSESDPMAFEETPKDLYPYMVNLHPPPLLFIF